MRITLAGARGSLFGLFVVFLTLLLACVAITFINDELSSEEMVPLTVKILTIYALPIGVIVGGFFGQRMSRAEPTFDARNFWVAFVLCTLWNILLVWRFIIFVSREYDKAEALSIYVNDVSAASLFLIVGALAYYFSKH